MRLDLNQIKIHFPALRNNSSVCSHLIGKIFLRKTYLLTVFDLISSILCQWRTMAHSTIFIQNDLQSGKSKKNVTKSNLKRGEKMCFCVQANFNPIERSGKKCSRLRITVFIFCYSDSHGNWKYTFICMKTSKKTRFQFIHLNEKCFCFPLKYCFFFVGPRHFVQRKYNKVFRVLNEPKLLETTGTKLISYRIYLREMRISRFVVITVGRYNLSWRTE